MNQISQAASVDDPTNYQDENSDIESSEPTKKASPRRESSLEEGLNVDVSGQGKKKSGKRKNPKGTPVNKRILRSDDKDGNKCGTCKTFVPVNDDNFGKGRVSTATGKRIWYCVICKSKIDP